MVLDAWHVSFTVKDIKKSMTLPRQEPGES